MRFLLTMIAVVGFAVMVLAFGSAYTVDTGNVAVITKWNKAVSQEGPNGLQFKNPITTGVEEFDVRERPVSGALNAATKNQLPTTMEYSVNWSPDPEKILFIFQKYGTPNDFAQNIILPRLNQSLKATIGKFDADELIREREKVAEAMAKGGLAMPGIPPVPRGGESPGGSARLLRDTSTKPDSRSWSRDDTGNM